MNVEKLNLVNLSKRELTSNEQKEINAGTVMVIVKPCSCEGTVDEVGISQKKSTKKMGHRNLYPKPIN